MAKRDENLTEEQKKAAGQTDSQKAMREYHEGAFQTEDPITHEPRDADERLQPARVDRGETVEDITGQTQNSADGGDDYDGWTVDELRAEAGDLDVRRRDGGDGAPVKADYVKALRKRDRSR